MNEKQRKVLVTTIPGAAVPIALSMLSTYRVVDTLCYTAAFLIAAFGVAGFVWEGRKQ